jgi:hypothetical protein
MKDQECMRHDCLNDGLSLSVLVILISCVVFCRTLFVLLYCLSLDLQLLITTLVSSTFSETAINHIENCKIGRRYDTIVHL